MGPTNGSNVVAFILYSLIVLWGSFINSLWYYYVMIYRDSTQMGGYCRNDYYKEEEKNSTYLPPRRLYDAAVGLTISLVIKAFDRL